MMNMTVILADMIGPKDHLQSAEMTGATHARENMRDRLHTNDPGHWTEKDNPCDLPLESVSVNHESQLLGHGLQRLLKQSLPTTLRKKAENGKSHLPKQPWRHQLTPNEQL